MKKGPVKSELPEETKPMYKNYLEEAKKYRSYETVSYGDKDEQYLERAAGKF